MSQDTRISVSYRARDCDSAWMEQIATNLSARGIDLQLEASGRKSPYQIVFFGGCREDLIGETAELTRTQARTLCIAGPGLNVPSSFIWQLLQNGVSDVLSSDASQFLDQIAFRLERWHSVETLMVSEPVLGLVGESAAWQRLIRQAVEVAHFTTSPVLILGETGTGKELLSRLIHDLDSRKGKRDLVTVDCTTIVSELSGSELFGHERGAFTGAVSSRDGAFALAHHGTLFLDEVGELPLTLQAQLLRAVQEKTYKRVGGNAWNQTDFRLVCATNRQLSEEVEKGAFRSDLYFRLASWVFQMPPLRERRRDIFPLARHFLQSLGGFEDPQFDPAVAAYLESRDYPGNIRELRQLVSRMGQRHVGPGPITAGDLPVEELLRLEVAAARQWPDAAFDEAIRRGLATGAGLKQISQAAGEAAIRITVQSEQGNLQRAAKRLGVTDRALQLRRAGGQLD
jgi:transcriptional regulator with GAF, ATPase, and Fis domain